LELHTLIGIGSVKKSEVITGFYVYDHIDVKSIRILQKKFDDLIQQLGYQPYHFPSVGLLEDLEKQKSHFKMNAEVLKLQKKVG
jgi:prolyl-tRNA synthetase